MLKKLSIIIPVYNVERYLPTCIDSLLRQGINEDLYEIILINDGSTDHSKEICQHYAAGYPQIAFVDQENNGVGDARNHGLDCCSGEYVAFVDSDDYVLEKGFGKILEVVQDHSHVDVIRFYSSYDFYPVQPIVAEVDYQGKAEGLLRGGGYPAFIWTHIYRKDFLNQHHIRFKTYRHSEDVLFISTVYLHNPYVLSVKANIYRYVLREESAIGRRTPDHVKRCVSDLLSSYEELQCQFEESEFVHNDAVRKACEKSANFKKISGYSRMLSACYLKHEFVNLKNRIKTNRYYPVVAWQENIRCKIICYSLNLVFSYYLIYKLSSLLFTKIIQPFILPWYRRRIWHRK